MPTQVGLTLSSDIETVRKGRKTGKSIVLPVEGIYFSEKGVTVRLLFFEGLDSHKVDGQDTDLKRYVSGRLVLTKNDIIETVV